MRSVLPAAMALIACLHPAQAQPLPEGVTACTMSGWSTSKNPKGAEIRAEPDQKAKVLGRLAPFKKAIMPADEEEYPNEGLWRTNFQIVGFKAGWFLIEQALHPYEDPGDIYLKRRKSLGMSTYRGRGWIPADIVGGRLSNRARPYPGALWQEPHQDAARLPAKAFEDRPISEGLSPTRVLSCQGEWVQVVSGDKVTGWWPGLCAAISGACAPPVN